MNIPRSARGLLACAATAAALGGGATAQAADPPVLDLETLTAQQAEQMLKAGTITSVQLTQEYIDRINAINKSGPGLNAVTQFNRQALVEAAAADKARADGKNLGPAMGLPILLKDIVDATPMYTSAGNYSLRNSFPAEDSGVAKNLRAHGVVILGKLGLSEFANYFGNQPSGFSNLTGQVLNAIDADQNPSGSSSGSGSAGAAALSALTIGTETSGSIISPSQTQGIVGLRPTVGLVPGYGIAPIIASQDTAGPMVRDVTAAAMTLQSIANPDDPEAAQEFTDVFGPNYKATGVIPTAPFGAASVPDYMSALDTSFVSAKRIGYTGTPAAGSPVQLAIDALKADGATVAQAPAQVTTGCSGGISNYEAHKTIDAYYAHLGPDAPIKSEEEEVAANLNNPQEALKFGNATHVANAQTDISPGGANETAFRSSIVAFKTACHNSLLNVFNNGTPGDTSDDFDAVIGSLSITPQAGYPQMTVPMGYVATTRRTQNVSVYSGPYAERTIIGVGYAIEQATKLRQTAANVDPSFYRCAHTSPPEPFASRGSCNPDYAAIMAAVGTAPKLPFSLELESAQSLADRLTAGTLSSEDLTKAYLARIALTNANGPATQAVRDVDLDAIAAAKAADTRRATDGKIGPLDGLPVLLDDSYDVKGTPTTGGSIALQNSMPAADSKVVARLKAAGAIILGKTNVTELNGVFDTNVPEGYSSLGGQVLLPSDTDKTPAGSSAGSAAATASGLAAMTFGMETSPDGAQIIAPASAAGVVALKPTVGRVSRTGILPASKSQDSPGPITRTVYDAALALQATAARDSADPATANAPVLTTDYTAGLSPNALKNKRIGVVASTTVPYPSALAGLSSAGATAVTRTPGTAPTQASIVSREFKRDVNSYLAGTTGGVSSLQGIIDYNVAHPVEGLKYQQGELLAAQSVDLSDPTANAAYTTDRDGGKTASQTYLDGLLNNGTPADTTDDVDLMMVPAGSALIGIADRAGYPVLDVPAGYGLTASGNGHDPAGVAFIGTAYSEATLLSEGYAFEQATKVRQAPSYTNPSMWRCVVGSTFFSPHQCHPGDLMYTAQFAAPPQVVPSPTATAPAATATATATATGTATATAVPTTAPTSAPTAVVPGATVTAEPGETGAALAASEKAVLRLLLVNEISNSKPKFAFVDNWILGSSVKYVLRIKSKGGYVRLAGTTVTVTPGAQKRAVLKLSKRDRKRLKANPTAKVVLSTTFTVDGASYTIKRLVSRS